MIDTAKIAPLIKKSIELGLELPLAGKFTPSDVMKLVQRKIILTSISKLVYNNKSYLDFVNQFPHVPQYVHYEDSHIIKTVTDHAQGLRFSSKSSWFLCCEAETKTKVYRLVIPLITDNVENGLLGVLTTAEHGFVLHWTEYGFIVSHKDQKRESKWVMKFSQARDDEKLEDNDKFWLMQLEDSAHLTLMFYNQERVKSIYGGKFPKELTLLRAWANILLQTANQNRFEHTSLNIYDTWEEFDGFVNWSYENGFNEDAIFVRIDRDKGYNPNNCEWIAHKEALERYGQHVIFQQIGPERYYSFEENVYLPISKIIKHPITINGETKSVIDWEFETGIPFFKILWRNERGLKDDDLIKPIIDTKEPVKYTNKDITINGVTKTAKEWAEESGISIKTIISRVRYGWKNDELLIPPKGAGHRVRS